MATLQRPNAAPIPVARTAPGQQYGKRTRHAHPCTTAHDRCTLVHWHALTKSGPLVGNAALSREGSLQEATCAAHLSHAAVRHTASQHVVERAKPLQACALYVTKTTNYSPSSACTNAKHAPRTWRQLGDLSENQLTTARTKPEHLQKPLAGSLAVDSRPPRSEDARDGVKQHELDAEPGSAGHPDWSGITLAKPRRP